MRIRDPGWRQFGSGMETVRIRDGKKSHLNIGDEREFLHHILHYQPRLVLNVLLYLENQTI
jgi:hypothetical protein